MPPLGFTPKDLRAVLPLRFNLTESSAATRFGVGLTDSCAVPLFGIAVIDSCAVPPLRFTPIDSCAVRLFGVIPTDSCAVPFTCTGSSTAVVFCTDHSTRLATVARGRFDTYDVAIYLDRMPLGTPSPALGECW